MDSRIALAADKGPYNDATMAVPSKTPTTQPLGPDTLAFWRPYNSRNHQGEGQNVLYGDGHSEFQRMPTAGIAGDNIYTVALNGGAESVRVSGESPWAHSAHPLERLGPDGKPLPTTDSLIFP